MLNRWGLRRLTSRQLAADVVVGAVWMLLGLLIVGRAGIQPMVVVVTAALSAALAVRRLAPGLALGVAWAGALLQVALGEGPNAYDLAIFAVLYATASYGSRLVRWLGLASAPVGAVVIAISQYGLSIGRFGGEPVVFAGITLPEAAWGAINTGVAFLIAFLLAWTLGSLARVWRSGREARAAERAAQQEVVVEQERNRIARDLHDVVAHSLAVVIAQADGARYTADPVAKDGALATISSSAREALGDVRLLLARLRHEEGAVPQPALTDLDALVDQVRDAGLEVRFERSGAPVELARGQELAVYRIVQEALTNALRHGDPEQPVVVQLDWEPDGLTVRIQNTSAGPRQPDGHGLPGMRERAVLAGGQAAAGPQGAEWVVTASVPAAVDA